MLGEVTGIRLEMSGIANNMRISRTVGDTGPFWEEKKQ